MKNICKNIIFLIFVFFPVLLYPQSPNVAINQYDKVYKEYSYQGIITVANFNNVGSFQIKLSFDNSIINITQKPAAAFNGRGVAVNSNPNLNGELVLVWISDGVNPLNFGSGTLMNFEFSVLPNAVNGISAIEFTQCIVSDVAGNSLNAVSSGGSINVFTPVPPNVIIDFIGNSSVGIVDVPVYVSDFKNVGSFTFEIDYDKTRVEFISLDQINPEINSSLIGSNIISIDQYINRLVITYSYNLLEPLFINDGGEVIFSLNFNYLNNQLLANLNFNNCLVNLPSGNSLYPTFSNGGIGGIVSVSEIEELPGTYSLSNFPNPFNSQTNIVFHIPINTDVTIEIFNTLGERLETLADNFFLSGTYRIAFNAEGYSSGSYFYRLKTSAKSITKKFLLIK